MDNLYYNSNCLEILKALPLKSIDYALTSPPYNRKRNDKYANYNDTLTDWYALNESVISHLLNITKEHIFYNIQANYYNRQDVYKLIGRFADNIQQIIVWEKSNPMPAGGHAITNATEYFIVMGQNALKSKTTYTKNILTTSVNSNMPKHHKAVMHQGVCDWFFDKFMIEGKSVIDPFMGLGTTGISAKKYGLDFIGIELDKQYCNDAKENINAYIIKG